MITRTLAIAGVALTLAAAPAFANDGRIVLIGIGAAAAAFGISAALAGTHVPPMYPGPSVVYLPPVAYAPPVTPPPCVAAPVLRD
jgi:hypothetical protein